MRVRILHDEGCPLGTNGLRAYQEAREAFASLPPEARATEEDILANGIAELELELLMKCNCGASRILSIEETKTMTKEEAEKIWPKE